MTSADARAASPPDERPTPRRHVPVAAIVFTLLTVLHTWPLVTDPSHLSRNDNADTRLNEWIVCWVAHTLPRDPFHLFNANIFYPEPRTLAFSEPLIPQGAMAIPLRWAGASPVLTYNLLLLLGLMLTGVMTSIVITSWTGDLWAGLVAGSAVAFNSQSMTRLAHLQAIHWGWLPLALWALDRLFLKARTRDALWLSFFVILLSLTSGYLAIFTVFMLAAATVMRVGDWWGPRAHAILPRLALAAGVSLLIVLPVLWPYRLARAEQGLRRSLAEVTHYSATPINYLVSGSIVHYDTWSHNFRNWHGRGHSALFPGATVAFLAIAVLGLYRDSLTGRRVWMLVGVAGVAFLLSLGTNTPVYRWLYDLLPPLEGIRAVGRFGNIVLLSAGLLAGFGLAEARARLPGQRRWRFAVSAVCLVLVNLEALHAPVSYDKFEGIPKIYRVIGKDPEPGTVVELPFYPYHEIFKNSAYVLASTEHWRPLLNGHSGYRPESYGRLVPVMRLFPSDDSIAALRARQVRYVVLHVTDMHPLYRQFVLQAIGLRSDLSLFFSDDQLSVYKLLPDSGINVRHSAAP